MDEDILAFSMFFCMVILMFVVILYIARTEARKNQMTHDERRLMIERGLVPPDPPQKPAKPIRLLTPDDYLRRGLLLLFLGIGLIVAPMLLLDTGFGSFGRSAAASGIVVGLLGVGNLVYYKASARRVEHGAGVEKTRGVRPS